MQQLQKEAEDRQNSNILLVTEKNELENKIETQIMHISQQENKREEPEVKLQQRLDNSDQKLFDIVKNYSYIDSFKNENENLNENLDIDKI